MSDLLPYELYQRAETKGYEFPPFSPERAMWFTIQRGIKQLIVEAEQEEKGVKS